MLVLRLRQLQAISDRDIHVPSVENTHYSIIQRAPLTAHLPTPVVAAPGNSDVTGLLHI